MAKVTAYYSAKPETKVFHDESGCTEGNNIESWNVRPGEGGKRRCDRCERLRASRVLLGGIGLLGGLNPFLRK